MHQCRLGIGGFGEKRRNICNSSIVNAYPNFAFSASLQVSCCTALAATNVNKNNVTNLHINGMCVDDLVVI